jgi:hypothetical protein
MRRFAVVVSAVATLMLVWTGAALAQDPPGCNGTIFLSGSSVQDGGNGTTPKFAHGDTVTVSGTGFDANQAFTGWTVDDVNSGTRVMDNSASPFTADASGNFSFSFSTSGLTDDHEYKVTVYFTKAVGNESCQKSKNFFLVSEEGGGAGGNPPPPPPPPTPPSGGGAGGAGAGGGGELGTIASGGPQGALPFTGAPAELIALAALALLLGGAALLWRNRTDG